MFLCSGVHNTLTIPRLHQLQLLKSRSGLEIYFPVNSRPIPRNKPGLATSPEQPWRLPTNTLGAGGVNPRERETPTDTIRKHITGENDP